MQVILWHVEWFSTLITFYLLKGRFTLPLMVCGAALRCVFKYLSNYLGLFGAAGFSPDVEIGLKSFSRFIERLEPTRTCKAMINS